ncbi:MAG: DUF2291 domain-containing protein [Pseudomonadota bacterium]
MEADERVPAGQTGDGLFSRGRLITAGAILAVLVAMGLDTTVVEIGSDEDLRQAAFDPDAFGQAEFPRISEAVRGRAVEAVFLAEAIAEDKNAAIESYGTKGGIGAYMPVQLEAVVGEGKSGIFDLTIEGMPEGTRVRLQTGPAINGTELRDITGDIIFGAFKNQIEFQDAGAGINRAMASEVLANLDRDTLTGKSVSVVGVFNLISAKNWLITPVSLEVEE